MERESHKTCNSQPRNVSTISTFFWIPVHILCTTTTTMEASGEEETSKKITACGMTLSDHFRKEDDDGGCESHSSMKKRDGLLLVPTKLKRAGLMMISSVFGQKKAAAAESCCFSESEKGKIHSMECNEDCKQSKSGRESQQTSLAVKEVPAKDKFSFKSLFRTKSFGFGFLRGKIKGRDGRSDNGFGKASIKVEGVEGSSGVLQRVSSRVAMNRLQGKGGRSIREKSPVKKIGAEKTVDMELCKKRILMGERCRPLSLSGSLQYDEDGILLADVLP